MISNILLYLDDAKYLNDYRKVGVSTFLLGLDGFCVGYKTYSVQEINNIDVSNKYVLINRILDCSDIDELKNIICSLKGLKGIVFEDIGVYQLIHDLNLSLELILFQNHFCTNSRSVSFWLKRVNSVFLSNEITYNEIYDIVNNVSKPVCVHLYGYNQVMYSRRLLLSNWCDEFNLVHVKENIIEDKATHVKFRAYENDYGTIMYSEKIYNGRRLLHLGNVLYFYVNTMLIDHCDIMRFLNDLDSFDDDKEDEGFLNKETIYKLKER